MCCGCVWRVIQTPAGAVEVKNSESKQKAAREQKRRSRKINETLAINESNQAPKASLKSAKTTSDLTTSQPVSLVGSKSSSNVSDSTSSNLLQPLPQRHPPLPPSYLPPPPPPLVSSQSGSALFTHPNSRQIVSFSIPEHQETETESTDKESNQENVIESDMIGTTTTTTTTTKSTKRAKRHQSEKATRRLSEEKKKKLLSQNLQSLGVDIKPEQRTTKQQINPSVDLRDSSSNEQKPPPSLKFVCRALLSSLKKIFSYSQKQNVCVRGREREREQMVA
jgi:hypothetical protein